MRLIDADELINYLNLTSKRHEHKIDDETYVSKEYFNTAVRTQTMLKAAMPLCDHRTLAIDMIVEDARSNMKPNCTSWVDHSDGDAVLVMVTAQVIKEADDGMD